MIEQPIIKLSRDQARTVQENFFPYLLMLCETKIRDAADDVNQVLNCRAIKSLYLEVKMLFDKKLQTKENLFTFKLTYSQSLAFHTLLHDLPIQEKFFWLKNLQTAIISNLHEQMIEP